MLLWVILGGLGFLALKHTAPSNVNSINGAAGAPNTKNTNAQPTNNPSSSNAGRIQNQNQPWTQPLIATGASLVPSLAGLFSQGANSISSLFGSSSSDGIEQQVDMTGVEMPDMVYEAQLEAGASGQDSSSNDETYYSDSYSDTSGVSDSSGDIFV